MEVVRARACGELGIICGVLGLVGALIVGPFLQSVLRTPIIGGVGYWYCLTGGLWMLMSIGLVYYGARYGVRAPAAVEHACIRSLATGGCECECPRT